MSNDYYRPILTNDLPLRNFPRYLPLYNPHKKPNSQ